MFTFFSNFKKEKIKIIKPKFYQEVGARFIISGWVPKTWLKTDFSIDYRIFIDLIDINGQTIMGSSIDVEKPKTNSWLSKFKKRCYFSSVFQFSQFNVDFIKKSQGRINIKLSGHKENEQSIYIPLIVKQLKPKEDADPEIVKKHGKIGEMIKQYEEDLKVYYEELDKIQKRRLRKNGISKKDDEWMDQYVQDWEISGGVLEIFEKAEGFNENYPFIQEDLEEKQLEKKYKNAIEWQEPLLGVVAGRMNGFEFMIFNNDYDKHFHVIHRGRGINARFSFPEVELINYKNIKTSISSKEKKKIINFFQNPENFKRLEEEFQRRD